MKEQHRVASEIDTHWSVVSHAAGGRTGAAAVPKRETDWRIVLERLQSQARKDGSIPIWVRVMELVIGATVLMLTAPILVVIAILVRMDSPGPALFRHNRVGKNGKLIRFTKFRTLYADARERFPELYAYKYTAKELEELCFKVPNDPRVTRLGNWLRTTTLDELPNFWHVITGEMALVGPRPEIPEMLPYYSEAGLAKFSVRPGITGFAQISGRGRLRFSETVRLDIEYVRNHSIRLDLKIMLRTLYLVLRRDGAF